MNKQEEQVLNQINEDEVVAFLQKLIQCKSSYPPGDTREVADACYKKLKEEGIETELLYPGDEVKSIWDDGVDNSHIPSVLGKLEGKERPVLLLNAHIDTVSVEDPDKWEFDPFSGAVKDGYIYGRGAGDDKSSVVAQIMATIAIARAGVQLNGTLMVNPVADEEASAFRGTHWLRDAGYLNPDYLLIGEQTDNKVAVAERAMLWLDVTIKGKAAHGAMPWEGDNAIVRASQFVNLVETQLVPLLKERTHPYLPHSTINISKINAGLNSNAVPEICTLLIDRRYVPGETKDTVIKEIEDLLKKLAIETGEFEWEVSINWDAGAPVDTDINEPLVQTLLGSAKEITGNKTELTGYRQGSDGRLFSGKGIPIAHFGPSDPAVGHSTNERVSIKQLVEATKIYALTALRMLS
ncbi:M20 family metallopeptidase [Alkalihalobacillus oceani]|uniref:M20 family metallopeptidase n=1 Tax=Halalkalibacter oceani TaxID=1653776 RepID=UPI00203BDDC9|nr:M20 family metallopeptidase [Halalkalibacter oceani]MCM3760442.1 M20 family metallopeptidase [Halalkalibacter oceani]